MKPSPNGNQLSKHVTKFSATISDSNAHINVTNINLDVEETDMLLNCGLLFPSSSSVSNNERKSSNGDVAVPAAYVPLALLICATNQPHNSICSADGVFDVYPNEIILKRLEIVINETDSSAESGKRKRVATTSPKAPTTSDSTKYRLKDYGWYLPNGHNWQIDGPATAGLKLKVLVAKKSNSSDATAIPIAPTSEKALYAQHPALALEGHSTQDILPSALFADITITVNAHQYSSDTTEQFAAVAAEHKAIQMLNDRRETEADDDEIQKRKRIVEATETDTLGPRRNWRLLLHRRWFMIRPEVRQATVRDSFTARHKYELSAQSLQQALDAEREDRYGHPDGPTGLLPKKRRGGRRKVYSEDDWDTSGDDSDSSDEEEDEEYYTRKGGKRGHRSERQQVVQRQPDENQEEDVDDDRYPFEKLSKKFPTLEQRLHRIRITAKEKYSGSVHEALAVSGCGKFILWRDGTETPMGEVTLFESTFVPANTSASEASADEGGIIVYKHPHRYSDIIGMIPYGSEATAIGMTTNKFTGEVFVCWKQLFVPARDVSIVAPSHSKETFRNHPSFNANHHTIEPGLDLNSRRDLGNKSKRNGSTTKTQHGKKETESDCPELVSVDAATANWNDMNDASTVSADIAPEGIIGWSVLKGFTAADNSKLEVTADQPSGTLQKERASLSALTEMAKSMIKGKANASASPNLTSPVTPTYFLVEKKLNGCIVFDTPRYFTSARTDRGVRIRAEPSIHSKQTGIMDANEVKEAVALHVDKIGNVFLEWKEMASSPGYDNAEVSPVPNTCDDASVLTYSVIQDRKRRSAMSNSTALIGSAQSVVASTDVQVPEATASDTAEPRAATPLGQVVAVAVDHMIEAIKRNPSGNGSTVAATPTTLAAAKAKRSNGGYSLARGPQGPGGGTFLVEIFPFNRTLAPLNLANLPIGAPSAFNDSEDDNAAAPTTGTTTDGKKKSLRSLFNASEPFRFTSSTSKKADQQQNAEDEVIDLDQEKDKRRRAKAFVDSLSRSKAKLLKVKEGSEEIEAGDNAHDPHHDLSSDYGDFSGDDEEDYGEEDEEDFDEEGEEFEEGSDEEDGDGWEYGHAFDSGSDDDEFEDDWVSDEGDVYSDDDEDIFAPKKTSKKTKDAKPAKKSVTTAPKPKYDDVKSKTQKDKPTKASNEAVPKKSNSKAATTTKAPIVEEPASDDSDFASEYGSDDFDAMDMDECSFEGSDDAGEYEGESD